MRGKAQCKLLAADFDERVDALINARNKCGFCERDESQIDELISSCRIPGKMICNYCVNEFHNTFRVESQFNDLFCGTDCDFCNEPPEAAVALIRKPSICICDACLQICRNILDPKFQAKREKKPELPSYCKLLIFEWDNRFEFQELPGSLLFTRLTGKEFSRIINRRRIPKRWRQKFEDEELNDRLEILESIVNLH